MPFFPVLGRRKLRDLCEFKANLVYTANSRLSTATQKEPCLFNKREGRKEGKVPVLTDLILQVTVPD